METIIKKTTEKHFQSGKYVEAIIINDISFIMSDKRGYSTHAVVSKEFAEEVINKYPVKIGKGAFGNAGKPVYMPDRLANERVILKWNLLQNDKIELMIHDSGHVWSSTELELIK